MKIFVGGLLEKQGCWPDPRPLRGDRDGWDSPGLHPGILPRLLRGPRWEAEKAQRVVLLHVLSKLVCQEPGCAEMGCSN